MTKHVKFPQTQHVDKFVGVVAVTQRQVPQVQTRAKTAAVSPAQSVGTVVDAPVIMQMRQRGPEMSPLRTPRNCVYVAVVSVNGLMQVTMKFRCCRATYMFR